MGKRVKCKSGEISKSYTLSDGKKYGSSNGIL
jgi:hypothetical protein